MQYVVVPLTTGFGLLTARTALQKLTMLSRANLNLRRLDSDVKMVITEPLSDLITRWSFEIHDIEFSNVNHRQVSDRM